MSIISYSQETDGAALAPAPGRAIRSLRDAQAIHERPTRKRKQRQLLANLGYQADARVQRSRLNSEAATDGKTAPPIAIVEHDIIPTLLECSDDAICVYIAYTRFANRYSAFSYPKHETLVRQLGTAPYFTDFITLRKTAHLKRGQKAKRAKQIENYKARTARAEQELVDAGLLLPSVRFDSHLRREFPIFVLLGPNGRPRTNSNGFMRRKFFKISAAMLNSGAFWIWRGRRRRTLILNGLELRMLLLALRDSDDLRFGGINPTQLRIDGDGAVDLSTSSWPTELGTDEAACLAAVGGLVRSGILTDSRVVSHIDDLHLIRSSPPANAPDEIDVVVFRIVA